MNNIVNIADKLLDWLTTVLSIISGCAMVLLTVVVFGEVLSRYVFRMPLVFTTELTALIFPWMIFLGVVAVTRRNEHLSINFLKNALPNSFQLCLTYMEKIIILIFCIYMLQSATGLTELMARQSLRTIDISRAWPYYSMVVSFALMSFVVVLQLIIMIFGKNKAEAPS